MALFLAIDAGGTKTKAVISTIVAGEAQVVAEGLALGANLAEVGLETCSTRLKLAVLNAIAQLPAPFAPSEAQKSVRDKSPVQFANVWIGVSGVDSPPDVRRLTPPMEAFFSTPVMVQNDALLLASPLIESATATGILAVGGTGSVCLAVGLNAAGEVEYLGRRGGLGFLLGDEGSAYHVGRTLLRLVLYAADAGTLDEDSPFTKALLEYWKVSHIDELLEKTYSVSPDLDPRDAENDRKLRISESCRLILSHAFPPPAAPFPHAPLALEAVRHSTQELAKDIAALVLSGRTQMDPLTSMLSLGGSLVAQPSYQGLLLDSLKNDFGVVFGKGVVHVGDAAADGALALAKLHSIN